MQTTTVYIMGYPIEIDYRIHDPSYIEWNVTANDGSEHESQLLNVLLRVHYNQFIEAVLREHDYYHEYAKRAGWESLPTFEDTQNKPF